MNVYEFKIGNIYQPTDGSGDFAIVKWEDLRAWSMGAVYGKPIYITCKWLKDFGFEDTSLAAFFIQYSKGGLSINIDGDDDVAVGMDYKGINLPCQKHVHQLQNLYHALTGEELTLKTK
jgi:hypothetical protein